MINQTKIWRIIDIINWGKNYLDNNNIQNARNEIEWLLCDILKYKRLDLYIKFEEPLNSKELKKFKNRLKRRISGEPLQHIIGTANYYGRNFKVNNNVLIPRPETEIIIDRIKLLSTPKSILDVGTGSGCIAITIALENLAQNIYATDISSNALDIAKENMIRLDSSKINFAQHDFLHSNFNKRFDVVVSNPPYIAKNDIDTLDSTVKEYDPIVALTDQNDGLSFYRRFAETFYDLLNPNGILILEFGGNNQKDPVKKIFESVNLKTNFIKDLQHDWRIVEVKK